MSDELKQTVRIVRGSKVGVDERGRSVWVGPVEEAELELVSTAMLKRVLESDDEATKRQIRDTPIDKDGVLAHDPEKDLFQIIDDADLKEILASEPKGMEAIKAADVTIEPLASRADTQDEELSLVSTQALRRMLSTDDESSDVADDSNPDDTGFDPYNTG